MLAKLDREVMLMKEEKEGREQNSFVVWVAVVLALALVVVILLVTVVVM